MASKILVIDDEPGIRSGCQRVLEPAGHLVETAETLTEGLNKAKTGQFDLVLLDVMLPDGQGITLLEPLAKIDPDLVTVIITGYATVELAVNAIRHGAYNFISKPFTVDTLLMTVNQGLERRRLVKEARRVAELEEKGQALEKARKEAEQLAEFKAHFAYLVAHELRSPVTGAQSLLRTLIKGMAGEINDRQKEILERLDLRLNNLLELINDLLTLASSKSISKETPRLPIPVLPVVKAVVEQFQLEAQAAGMMLNYKAIGEMGKVLAFEDDLKKVISNLVSNAIKYTPRNGHVEVLVSRQFGKVSIAVSDTGIGIPEEALQHLGEEFFRAPNARERNIPGTGLGLSIVRQYLNQMGGELKIESKQGAGSTFTVILPEA